MNTKSRIGIIGAMDSEIEHLASRLENKTMTEAGGYAFHSGILCGKQVVILKSGVGKVNAARGTQLLIDRFSPDAILNTGIAGAASPDLHVGDAVIASGLVQHDFDVTAFGYAQGYLCTGADQDKPTVFMPDNTLTDRLTAAAGQILEKTKVKGSVIATGDAFVADVRKRKYIQSQFNAAAVEMESAAIAQTASCASVPFAVLRVISDNADGNAAEISDQFEADTARRSAEIIMECLKHS